MDPFLVSNVLSNIPKQFVFLILLTRQVIFCCKNVLSVDVSCRTYRGSPHTLYFRYWSKGSESNTFACTLRKSLNPFRLFRSTLEDISVYVHWMNKTFSYSRILEILAFCHLKQHFFSLFYSWLKVVRYNVSKYWNKGKRGIWNDLIHW